MRSTVGRVPPVDQCPTEIFRPCRALSRRLAALSCTAGIAGARKAPGSAPFSRSRPVMCKDSGIKRLDWLREPDSNPHYAAGILPRVRSRLAPQPDLRYCFNSIILDRRDRRRMTTSSCSIQPSPSKPSRKASSRCRFVDLFSTSVSAWLAMSIGWRRTKLNGVYSRPY
jgi:hypothetical protein